MFRPNLQNEEHRRAWEILQTVPEGQKNAFLVQVILENAQREELETILRRVAHEKRRNITQVINIFLFFFVGGKFAYLQRTHPFQKQTLFLCCYIHPFS